MMGMGWLTTLRTLNELHTTGLSADPVAVAGSPDTAPTFPRLSRAERVAVDITMSIPAVRKAVAVIAGTISTFEFIAWEQRTSLAIPGTDRRISWLQKPDTTEELTWTLSHSIRDLIWYDRCVWRISDRIIDGTPVKADRIHPDRIDTLPDPLDADRIRTWLIDGREVDRRPQLIVFQGAGLGGLRRYGFDLLTLYGQLQAAAGRYATAPHPHAILKNHGADLDDDEISDLLDDWEAARATRSIGYLNDVIDYETHGWNAKELQLTEAREHAALEVARLFGLPAKAVDAPSGGSMTYANAVEARRDILEAIRPWMTVMTTALSSRCGVKVEFDADAYTRDDPAGRMNTWAAALSNQVLTLDEVRALEPLAARSNP